MYLYCIYDFSVKVSCLITNRKQCTDETIIKKVSEDVTFFPQKTITEPISYHVLTATVKLMIFLSGRYGSKEFWFVGIHVINVWHMLVIQKYVKWEVLLV
jgi:hypothetical protein